MTELQTVLEWIGMGLVGFLILSVVIMLSGLFNSGRRDRDWE